MRSHFVRTEIALNLEPDQQSFRNIALSYRGAERQPPNVLQLALRFSAVMDRSNLDASAGTEMKLKKVVAAFNGSPGLNVKHQIDPEKERAILNLICGSTKAGLTVSVHTNTFFKFIMVVFD